MGFGILFLGYFATTMMSIPLSRMLPIDLGGIITLFGYVLIIIAAKKLSEYNSSFKTLIATSALMVGISGFEAFVDITAFLADQQIAQFSFSAAICASISFVFLSVRYVTGSDFFNETTSCIHSIPCILTSL